MRSKSKTEATRRRLVVVSGYGRDAFTPRGQRTRHLVEALDGEWDVDLVAMPGKPSSALPDGSPPRQAAIRRLAVRALRRVLLDRWEPWSVRSLSRWNPDADAALLIASPWSPVVYASRRLVRAGIPYVVDVGDPWVLTADPTPSLPIWRASRAERFLWEHAAGAVVTTRAQFETLHAMFPDLPIVIRPNGYRPVERVATQPSAAPRPASSLKIAHFGILSPARIDPLPFIADLQRSGLWQSITFCQFGDDFGVGLDRVALDAVKIEHNSPQPWEKVIERAPEFDAALVVAYPLPALLPSKAIEYSTLPLPRIALTNPDSDDALREYVRNREGWLALSHGEPEIGRRVREHVQRPWSPTELAPLAEDAWPEVAARVAEFLTTCVGNHADVASVDR